MQRLIKQYFFKRIAAFSLLEMAFVLMIMGCILTVSLPFFSSKLNLEKDRQTHDHFHQIAYSLAAHLMRHGRLPCPAIVTAETTEFGTENMNTCTTPGIIPYKTLGLSPGVIKDGHGHYITFVVHPLFSEKPRPFLSEEEGNTQKDPFLGNNEDESYCHVKGNHALKIFDDHKNMINEDPQNDPVFILISHGKNGGDFLTTGQRRPLTQEDSLKIENTNDDNVFVEGARTSTFDDLIFWKDRYTFSSVFGSRNCH